MSANILNYPSKELTVQDDMESFFHLLLYQAIRYLPHSCHNVCTFVDKYFNDYEKEDGVYYGGEKKMAAIRQGALTTTRNKALKFYLSEVTPTPAGALTAQSWSTSSRDHGHSHLGSETNLPTSTTSPNSRSPARTSQKLHPINGLFTDLLQLLQAHYLLNVPIEESSNIPGSGPTAEVTQEPEVDFIIATRLSMLRETGFEYDWPLSATPAPDVSPSASPEEQAKTQALAAKLASHKALIKVIMDRSLRGKWPKEDRVRDELSENHRHIADLGAPVKAEAHPH
ncbi:hypothetical protein GY45DRAFT_1320318 [Cubamyces sp. BRFM 1775]|nr:hypothetical protein GY45DRAFT_1320318 [Cubamyces sp. BRFM 1775]